MADFLSFIFGLWLVGSFVASPYFWFKKTDRSQAPLARRLAACAYGLAWPYFLIQAFAGQKTKQTDKKEQESAHERILGNADPKLPTVLKPQTKIKNPFEEA